MTITQLIFVFASVNIHSVMFVVITIIIIFIIIIIVIIIRRRGVTGVAVRGSA